MVKEKRCSRNTKYSKKRYIIDLQQVTGKVKSSRYNKNYKKIMEIGRPSYKRRNAQAKIAKLRCGNFEEANRY